VKGKLWPGLVVGAVVVVTEVLVGVDEAVVEVGATEVLVVTALPTGLPDGGAGLVRVVVVVVVGTARIYTGLLAPLSGLN
jgi:hypothetical protein